MVRNTLIDFFFAGLEQKVDILQLVIMVLVR